MLEEKKTKIFYNLTTWEDGKLKVYAIFPRFPASV